RAETDNLSAANIIYPAMQTTDIFHVMKCQVTQLGLDQRKVNLLARQVGPELGFWKPIVLSHGMLQGLGNPSSEFESIWYEFTKGAVAFRVPVAMRIASSDTHLPPQRSREYRAFVVAGYGHGGGRIATDDGSETYVGPHRFTVNHTSNGEKISLICDIRKPA